MASKTYNIEFINDLFFKTPLQMSGAADKVVEFKGRANEHDIVVHLQVEPGDGKTPSHVEFVEVEEWDHVLIRNPDGDVVYEYMGWD